MSLIRKVAPAPLTSAVVFALWLALARDTSAGTIALALAFAVGVPILTGRLRANVKVRRPLVVVRFLLVVGYDVVRSNLQVAWGVLAWRWRRPRSMFVIIPLDLHDPVGLAALAMVTTVELAVDRSAMLLHVWNVEEERAFVARFKARYEKPLREIFE